MLLDAGWNTNLPRFQGTRPDHACESKVQFVVSLGVSEF